MLPVVMVLVQESWHKGSSTSSLLIPVVVHDKIEPMGDFFPAFCLVINVVGEITLQCFHAVGWAAEEHSAFKKLSGEVLGWSSVWGPADATVTHYLLFQSIQIGFSFLAPAHPGSPGQRAIKWVLLFLCSVRDIA